MSQIIVDAKQVLQILSDYYVDFLNPLLVDTTVVTYKQDIKKMIEKSHNILTSLTNTPQSDNYNFDLNNVINLTLLTNTLKLIYSYYTENKYLNPHKSTLSASTDHHMSLYNAYNKMSDKYIFYIFKIDSQMKRLIDNMLDTTEFTDDDLLNIQKLYHNDTLIFEFYKKVLISAIKKQSKNKLVEEMVKADYYFLFKSELTTQTSGNILIDLLSVQIDKNLYNLAEFKEETDFVVKHYVIMPEYIHYTTSKLFTTPIVKNAGLTPEIVETFKTISSNSNNSVKISTTVSYLGTEYTFGDATFIQLVNNIENIYDKTFSLIEIVSDNTYRKYLYNNIFITKVNKSILNFLCCIPENCTKINEMIENSAVDDMFTDEQIDLSNVKLSVGLSILDIRSKIHQILLGYILRKLPSNPPKSIENTIYEIVTDKAFIDFYSNTLLSIYNNVSTVNDIEIFLSYNKAFIEHLKKFPKQIVNSFTFIKDKNGTFNKDNISAFLNNLMFKAISEDDKIFTSFKYKNYMLTAFKHS